MPDLGYGKTILFGEHFAVYGLRAIVSSLSTSTWCEVSLGGGQLQIDDQRPETPGYKQEKLEQQLESIRLIAGKLDARVLDRGMKVTFGGDLVAASGVGASAASCTALARALSRALGLMLDDQAINALAYEGERAYHGRPSGIDNTASTYGGLLLFWRDLEKGTQHFERIRCPRPLPILLADTGITADTAAVVAQVRAKRAQTADAMNGLFDNYAKLAERSCHLLSTADLPAIGRAMDENQEMLRMLGVSCPQIETVIALAKSQGACGAKLTGTGMGGLVLALMPDTRAQSNLQHVLAGKGYRTFTASLGDCAG